MIPRSINTTVRNRLYAMGLQVRMSLDRLTLPSQYCYEDILEELNDVIVVASSL